MQIRFWSHWSIKRGGGCGGIEGEGEDGLLFFKERVSPVCGWYVLVAAKHEVICVNRRLCYDGRQGLQFD